MGQLPAKSTTKGTTKTVQPGDTLWDIAQRTLGDGSRWRELQGYVGDPRMLQPGTPIGIPHYNNILAYNNQNFNGQTPDSSPFANILGYNNAFLNPPVPNSPTSPAQIPVSLAPSGSDSPSASMTAAKPATSTTGNTAAMQPATHPVFDKPVSSPDFVDGTPDWVKASIQQAADKYNIPTMMLSALLKQESGFNPNARSPVGALGIAQFMPGTAQEMGINPADPASAIMGAAHYLRQGWDRFGKPELALAAYNAGGGAVQKYGGIPPYKETQNYVKNIMSMASQPHQSANGPYLDTMNQMQASATRPATKTLASNTPAISPAAPQSPGNTTNRTAPPAWVDLATSHLSPRMNPTDPSIRPGGIG